MSDNQLSGRDLDAAVAERVMGWTLIDAKGEDWFDSIPAEAFPIFVRWPEGGTAIYESQHDIRSLEFRPSESIEAAMQVVAWLCPTIKEYNAGRKSCRFIMRQDDSGLWSVEARSPFLTSYDTPAFADGKSLPEAICRAALKAVESK